MNLNISGKVRKKLEGKDPPVTESEIYQCFQNLTGTYLIDERENHKTIPPTLWFVAETNNLRTLKVMFVYENEIFYIKSAYSATDEIRRIYDINAY